MSGIGSARAAFFNGNSFLAVCESDAFAERNTCRAYLGGIVDNHNTLNKWKLLTTKLFCTPLEVTAIQLAKVFVKYANDNPQDLHLSASSVVINAFVKAFPCE